jgi:spore coat protein U-like protein
MMRRILLTAAALGLALFAAPALAQSTNTGTLAVSATVVTSCEITATPLGFGNYDGAQNDSTSTITVNCNTASVPYDVELGNGGNWSGTTRQMANGAARLGYALFSDAGRTTLWEGVGVVQSGTTSAATPSTDSTIVIYGRIPANQILTTTGLYTDSVTMTVSF